MPSILNGVLWRWWRCLGLRGRPIVAAIRLASERARACLEMLQEAVSCCVDGLSEAYRRTGRPTTSCGRPISAPEPTLSTRAPVGVTVGVKTAL